MIQIVNVNKQYHQRTVLEDISLTIPKGTITGVIGRNGSGKSTLLRLLCGILSPDAGFVAYNEQHVFDNVQAKKDIYLVADDTHFLSKATIGEMKRFYKVFYKHFDDERFENLLETFHMREDMILNSFSKGMKRQINLILGLSSQTPVLILDEAFDGLDPVVRFRIRQLISDDVSQSHRTIIISSHNLEEISDICDSLILIDQKQVRFSYTHDEFEKQYHKYRIAFNEAQDRSIFDALDCIYVGGLSKIFTIIVRGDAATIETHLAQLGPILIEEDTVDLNEVFIQELGETL